MINFEYPRAERGDLHKERLRKVAKRLTKVRCIKAKGYFEGLIGRKLGLKYVPELRFHPQATLEPPMQF